MGGRRIYNYHVIPPGTRVRVHAASRGEGTDHEWHGHEGTLIRNGMWVLVKMDKRVRHWPSNEVLICNHNLQPAPKPNHGNQ